MSIIVSKEQICNMAAGHLGNYETINSITNPVLDKEKVFALWYDITRQALLRAVMPSFAMQRRRVSAVPSAAPAFGFENVYERPSDCLRVLGVDEMYLKNSNDYVVEGDYIYTKDEYEDGLPIRFIYDEQTVTKFSPEFCMLFSWELAANTALAITQDQSKANSIRAMLPAKYAELGSISSQENKPLRISNSRFREARFYDVSRNPQKK